MYNDLTRYTKCTVHFILNNNSTNVKGYLRRVLTVCDSKIGTNETFEFQLK